jgi:hypothetical protein
MVLVHRAAPGRDVDVVAAMAAALCFFFPHLHHDEATYYSRVIAEEAWIAGIDPVTLAARGWVESGMRPRTLHAGTHGIWQCRDRVVTVRSQAACGARALAFWQEWEGRCKEEPTHQYFRHYTFGWKLPLWAKQEKQWKMLRVARLLERRMNASQNGNN